MATILNTPRVAAGRSRSHDAAFAIQCGCLALVVVALIAAANRSFDHTDEAYYVAWIRQPTDFAQWARGASAVVIQRTILGTLH